MPTLLLTIQGPFAYVPNYPVFGLVTLMAPLCSQHKGGISSIGSGCEFIFAGNGCNRRGISRSEYEYSLGLKVGSISNTSWKRQGNVLNIPPDGIKFDPSIWRFWVVLPLPDVLVTINPVNAKIKAPTTVVDPPYSVGVRFVYKNWDGNDMPIYLNGKPALNLGVPVVFHFGDLGEDDHWDMEIEYAGALRDDPDHEDAVTCFENLMKAVGRPDWSIEFPTSQADATRLNDCKAAIVWVE